MTYPRAYLLMFSLAFLQATSSFMVSPVLPLYAQMLGATGVLVGFIISGYFISKAFAELPSGMIGDRIGRRTPMLIGLLVSMSGFLACAISRDPYQLMFGRMLGGFGGGLFFCTSMTLVTELFDASKRGRALGMYLSVEFIGGFVGPIVGGFVANLAGFANTFYVCLALVVPTFLLALSSSDLRRETSRKVVSHSPRPVSYVGLRNFTLTAVSLVAFLRVFDEQGLMNTVLPVYASRFLGMDVALIGILMGAKAAGYVFAAVVAGFMCDKVGRKKTLLTGIVITSSAVYLLGVSARFESLMVFSALAGAGSGMIMIPLPALAVESVPLSLRGTAIGIFRTLFDMGAVVGPVSLTFILGLAGPTACFYVASTAILSGALAVALIREKRSSMTSSYEIEQ